MAWYSGCFLPPIDVPFPKVGSGPLVAIRDEEADEFASAPTPAGRGPVKQGLVLCRYRLRVPATLCIPNEPPFFADADGQSCECPVIRTQQSHPIRAKTAGRHSRADHPANCPIGSVRRAPETQLVAQSMRVAWSICNCHITMRGIKCLLTGCPTGQRPNQCINQDRQLLSAGYEACLLNSGQLTPNADAEHWLAPATPEHPAAPNNGARIRVASPGSWITARGARPAEQGLGTGRWPPACYSTSPAPAACWATCNWGSTGKPSPS